MCTYVFLAFLMSTHSNFKMYHMALWYITLFISSATPAVSSLTHDSDTQTLTCTSTDSLATTVVTCSGVARMYMMPGHKWLLMVILCGAKRRAIFFCKTLHLFAVGTAVLKCFITLLGLLGTRLLPLNPIKKSTLATIGLLLSLRLAALQSDVVKSRNLLLS